MNNVDEEDFELAVSSMTRVLQEMMTAGQAPADAREELKRKLSRQFGRYPQEVLSDQLKALERAYNDILKKLNNVRFITKRAIRFGHEQWYLGPTAEGSLWQRYSDQLTRLGRDANEIEKVDTDSTIVVGLLDNPQTPAFSTRGLVVGHVQSGKTGNIAAVISKAAETPFKFFLVLSGLTDQLRNQTQARLERDVVDLAPERWMKWTSVDHEGVSGDFSEKAVGGFGFDHRNQIAVIKKNPAVLRRFLAKLNNTSEVTLRETPFLIIDDECDQASVNSAKLDKTVSTINGLIQRLIRKIPRASYVGYTATPFANVLIDPSVPEDLYPRSFIHALQRPSRYFGAEELFGRNALGGEHSDSPEGFDMIRTIPESEISSLRVNGDKAASVVMTPAIESAIRYFLMVVAARRVRGQQAYDNTMLVHTSLLQSVHATTAVIIRKYVERLRAEICKSDESLLDVLQKEWEEEQNRVLSVQFDRNPVRFESLRPELPRVLSDVKVHVENWKSTERLDYTKGIPQTLIVVGGNVLARGLTLEGLSVSFFLRSSSQYDTLMQMGRWFGYREGFEDLPRVWVEERVRTAFFDLASVESEIRSEIARYAEEEISPKDFAVKIRTIPGMAITAPAKMRSAVRVEIGFAGTHVQTIRFYRNNTELLRRNWLAAADLISSLDAADSKNRVFRNVPAERVVEFLRRYTPHETHRSLSPEFLLKFIQKAVDADPRMVNWSVVVVEGHGGNSREPLGSMGPVKTVIRSAEMDSTDNASVKALMSRSDILLDLEHPPKYDGNMSWDALKEIRESRKAPPLLVLYPIQAESKPGRSKNDQAKNPREPLNATFDVLGFGIVFPGDKQLSGTYVSAPIPPEREEPEDYVAPEDDIPEEILSGTAQENSA